jgi:hypothetical protein
MRIKLTIIFGLVVILVFVFFNRSSTKPPSDNRVVRCAVIGGMTMTGLWPEIVRRFETDTGYRCELVATGPRPEIAELGHTRRRCICLVAFADRQLRCGRGIVGLGLGGRQWRGAAKRAVRRVDALSAEQCSRLAEWNIGARELVGDPKPTHPQ